MIFAIVYLMIGAGVSAECVEMLRDEVERAIERGESKLLVCVSLIVSALFFAALWPVFVVRWMTRWR